MERIGADLPFPVEANGGPVFDPLALARLCGQLAGDLALSRCSRLTERLVDVAGELQYRLRGACDAEGRAFLLLRVSGQIRLLCQRCLQPFDWPVAIDSRLLLVPPGHAWPEDDDVGGLEDASADAIEAVAEMSLADLVEDEVLLALPMVPRHEVCLSLAGENAGDRAGAVFGGEEPSGPFAVLAGLKRH